MSGLRPLARLWLPDVVIFLLVGIAIGPFGFRLIEFGPQNSVVRTIFVGGAAVVLFEGGQQIELPVLGRTWLAVASLATIGVAVSAAVMTAFVRLAYGWPWLQCMLLAAVLAPTDPTVIVPLFNRLKIRSKVRQVVISEAAANDATGAALAMALTGVALSGGALSPLVMGEVLVRSAAGGVVVGVVIGALVALLRCIAVIRLLHHRYARVRDVATLLAGAIGAYLGAESAGGAGYMAAFVAGVTLSALVSARRAQSENGARVDFGGSTQPASRGHVSDPAVAPLRFLLFTLLGAQANLALLAQSWTVIGGAALCLMVVARPLSVWGAVSWDPINRWRTRELLFIASVRETGVIPAALVASLLALQVPHAQQMATAVFAVILATVLIQSPTMGLVAHWLRQDAADGR